MRLHKGHATQLKMSLLFCTIYMLADDHLGANNIFYILLIDNPQHREKYKCGMSPVSSEARSQEYEVNKSQ